ncbi:hypothetical protein CIPAW_16G045100 [Carya illinoinensis]|uniref:EF-hand domain-containing protein n=1 Tax=Carya illinoinensis TaxID=32201 RepID=A0A8T1N5I6_CARIL|nr:hypothetical protein CIPAW_16G045100 [Carya illinoinensis]KAG6672148.1 hypothetical protein I3842_16G043900 [Carya illinoinensis]
MTRHLFHSPYCNNITSHQSSKEAPLNEEQLRDQILKKYDVNHDGGLSKEELKAAFQSLGAFLPSWRANRALRHADTNRDGLVSGEELKVLIQYAKKHGYIHIPY